VCISHLSHACYIPRLLSCSIRLWLVTGGFKYSEQFLELCEIEWRLVQILISSWPLAEVGNFKGFPPHTLATPASSGRPKHDDRGSIAVNSWTYGNWWFKYFICSSGWEPSSLPPFLPSFLPSFTHSFIHSIHSFDSFIHSFIRLIHSFISSFILSILHSSFIPSIIPSFLPSFLHSFIHSFTHSLIYSFIYFIIHSFIPSFLIHSFIHFFFLPSFLPSFSHSFLYSFINLFINSFLHSFIPCNEFTTLHLLLSRWEDSLRSYISGYIMSRARTEWRWVVSHRLRPL
jgi:hypothetical protein